MELSYVIPIDDAYAQQIFAGAFFVVCMHWEYVFLLFLDNWLLIQVWRPLRFAEQDFNQATSE